MKRVAPVFAGCSTETKTAILVKLAEHIPSTESQFNVVCNVIESLFHVNYHRGRFTKIVLKDEDAQVLVDVACQLARKKTVKLTEDSRYGQ